MSLTEVNVPAYVTIAFGLDGAVIIQQIQYRDIILRDGVPIDDGKLLPPEFIKAPQVNDVITKTLTDALSAVTAGQLLALAKEQEVTVALTADYEAKLTAKAGEAEVLNATIADLTAQVAGLDAVIAAGCESVEAPIDAAPIALESVPSP